MKQTKNLKKATLLLIPFLILSSLLVIFLTQSQTKKPQKLNTQATKPHHVASIAFYDMQGLGLQTCDTNSKKWQEMLANLDKAVDLEVDTVNLGWPAKKNISPPCMAAFKEFIRQAHQRGLKVQWTLALNLTYWLDNTNPDLPPPPNVHQIRAYYCKPPYGPCKWNPQRAIGQLKKWQDPEFNQLVDYIYLYHEVHLSGLTHQERVRLNKIVKQYFPHPKTYYHWGSNGITIGTNTSFNGQDVLKKGKPNPIRPDLLNNAFKYGQGESDITFISIYRDHPGATDPVISFNRQYKIIHQQTPKKPIRVLVHWGEDDAMDKKNVIWSPKKIKKFKKEIKTVAGKIDQLVWRYGQGKGAIDFYAPDVWKKRKAFEEANIFLRGYSIKPTPQPSTTLIPTITSSPSPIPTSSIIPTPSPFPEITATPTPSPQPDQGQLVFKIKLPGVKGKDKRQAVNVTLKSTTGEVEKEAMTTITSNQEGIFTGTITNLSPGLYNIYLKPEIHLQRKFNLVEIKPGKNLFDWRQIKFIPGDFNNDNVLNVLDLALILQQYKILNTPVNSQNKKYDVNLDGVINITDIALVMQNYIRLQVPGDKK